MESGMRVTISKIRLINYKKFTDYTIEPNEYVNILVGDNEAGKSSILEAIDIVANGSVSRIEKIGLDRLISIDAVAKFNSGERNFKNLPKLTIELYLSGIIDHTMNGDNNSEERTCDGIRLICEPNLDYVTEINESLNENPGYFPYDYYSVRFSTFSDEGYTSYKKKIRSCLINSSNMSSEYATSDFIKRAYRKYTEDNIKNRAKLQSNYRLSRIAFQEEKLNELNQIIDTDKNYKFGLRSSNALSFEEDLMIYEDNIGIDNKGTGRQIMIKTDFALGRAGENIDLILMEEPENHLSPINLRSLVERISKENNSQLFITTHSSFISTRLDLQNLLIISNDNNIEKPTKLSNLADDTAKYFMKAPPAGVIEYALSKKVILIEGPAEYILFEKFYKIITGHTPEEKDVQVIDVRGLSFKRYLAIAKLTNTKTAVVTDNDGDIQKNCIDKYSEYSDEKNIKIFYENNINKNTFEVVLFEDNISLCEGLFGLDALKYMLNNKTEAAFKILTSKNDSIKVPDYIREAIEWINE